MEKIFSPVKETSIRIRNSQEALIPASTEPGTGKNDDYGDLALQADSPCTDKGLNTTISSDTIKEIINALTGIDIEDILIDLSRDCAGKPRISNVTVDMGAYEFQF